MNNQVRCLCSVRTPVQAVQLRCRRQRAVVILCCCVVEVEMEEVEVGVSGGMGRR